MILLIYAIGGFAVGMLTTILAFMRYLRKAEQEAFNRYWGPP